MTPDPAEAAAAQPEASLFANRDYLGWWTGNTLSAVGDSITMIAYPLLVLYATGSVLGAGSITAANMIGAWAMTLPGGVLADRCSRKAIMVLGPLVQAAAMATVALLVHAGSDPVWLLAVVALVSGMASGLTKAAATPALRRIIRKDQVGAATAQALGRDMAAEFVGAPLGGVLFSVARWIPFVGDAASYLFASIGAALIRRPLGPERVPGAARSGAVADVRAGFGFVRAHPYLRFTIVWAACLNVVAQGFVLLFIALVKYRGGGPVAVGVVNSVALVGGIAGAVVGPLLLKRMRARLVLQLALLAFVVTFALVAVVPRPWEIGAVLLVAMLTMVPLNVVLESYEVRLVPDEFSGRVAAVTRFGLQSLQWTGPLLAGLLVSAFGVPGGALAMTVLLLPLLVALYRTRALGVLEQPVDQVQELAAPGGPQRPAHPGNHPKNHPNTHEGSTTHEEARRSIEHVQS